ncbi:MAG: hypothetical protein WB676_10115 [Bryobacteraceae bacterium]
MRFHFLAKFFQSSGRNDVVSIEDRPRFVAADLHRLFLAESGFDHIRESRPAQVVIESFGNAERFAGTLPRLFEIKDGMPFMLNQKRARRVGRG